MTEPIRLNAEEFLEKVATSEKWVIQYPTMSDPSLVIAVPEGDGKALYYGPDPTEQSAAEFKDFYEKLDAMTETYRFIDPDVELYKKPEE